MRRANIHAAKTKLSQLIETAVNGEPVVLAKAGKPDPAGRVGFFEGRVEVPDDFDSMGAKEIHAMFEGVE